MWPREGGERDEKLIRLSPATPFVAAPHLQTATRASVGRCVAVATARRAFSGVSGTIRARALELRFESDVFEKLLPDILVFELASEFRCHGAAFDVANTA